MAKHIKAGHRKQDNNTKHISKSASFATEIACEAVLNTGDRTMNWCICAQGKMESDKRITHKHMQTTYHEVMPLRNNQHQHTVKHVS